MNGDGLPDLIYLQGNGAEGSPTYPSVAVLLNTGSGYAAQPIVSAPLACFAGTPITADVNGDKKQDAILSCDGFLVVMLGNGDGTFQAPTTSAAPGLASLLAVDLNGDGFPDIVGVDSSTDDIGPPPAPQISILLNKGAASPGTFGAATSQSGNGNLLMAGDFNGDGKQDVVLASSEPQATTQNTINVFFGSGDGTLQSPLAAASGYIYTYAVGDWNGDGISDIAYVSTSATTNGIPALLTLDGATSGKFTSGSALNLSPETTYAQLLALQHPSASGYLTELALVGDFTTLFFGNSNGSFVAGPSYAYSGSAIEQVNSDSSTQLQYFSNGYLLSAPVVNGGLQGFAADPINHFGNSQTSSFASVTPYALGDLNGDGLPDIVSLSSTGELTASLSRGNGAFSTASLTSTQANGLLVGDFNGDGKQDILAYIAGNSPGFPEGSTQQLPQTLFYQGNGIGTVATTPVSTTFPLTQISDVVSGDFNGDGVLDLVIVALENSNDQQSSGIFFAAGKGDGSFAAPVLVDQAPSTFSGNLLASDLNHDGKLDFVFGNGSFVGNGDGTFQATPLGLATGVGAVALADLNGDGNSDMVTNGGAVLAGNGDGTFQTSSFFSISIPTGASLFAVSIGDVNGDGNADVIAQLAISNSISWLSISEGDGKGDFTADPQMYYAGGVLATGSGAMAPGLLTRLNSTAPALASDSALDYLSVSSSYVVVPMLNTGNAAPTAPALLPSTSTLATSTASTLAGTSITLTATVTGYQVSGQVTFNAGGTSLGTAMLNAGVATLPVSFSAAGSYAITAMYGGDSNNAASTSNMVTVTVTAPVTPDFTVTASPTSATVTDGQSAMTTLTVTPNSTYSGSVSFSCGTLPAGVTCSFSPATVSTAKGAATTVLTITTTAASTAWLAEPGSNLGKAALAGIFCLLFLPFGATSRRWKAARASFLCLCLMSVLFALSACGGSSSTSSGGSSSGGGTTASTGTPTGNQTITVQISDSSTGLSHQVPFTLTVQ